MRKPISAAPVLEAHKRERRKEARPGELLEAARWHARAGTWAGTKDPKASLRHWRKVREQTDTLPASDESAALGRQARILMLGNGWRLGISDQEAEALFAEGERMAVQAQDTWSQALLLGAYATIQVTNEGRVREALTPVRQEVALAEEERLEREADRRYWQPLRALVRGLEEQLGHPCQANAYLTPPGSQGFALHSDTHDVFVFQTFGAKEWEVHDEAGAHRLDLVQATPTSSGRNMGISSSSAAWSMVAYGSTPFNARG